MLVHFSQLLYLLFYVGFLLLQKFNLPHHGIDLQQHVIPLGLKGLYRLIVLPCQDSRCVLFKPRLEFYKVVQELIQARIAHSTLLLHYPYQILNLLHHIKLIDPLVVYGIC